MGIGWLEPPADNRRCKDKGPHPHHAGSFMRLSPPACLLRQTARPLRLFVLPGLPFAPPLSPCFSPLSRPFSISLALSIPLPPHHHLFSPPPPLPPPLLSRVYCSRKSSTDTSMCVFVRVCVCVTTVRTVSEAHTITSKGGGIFFFFNA